MGLTIFCILSLQIGDPFRPNLAAPILGPGYISSARDFRTQMQLIR